MKSLISVTCCFFALLIQSSFAQQLKVGFIAPFSGGAKSYGDALKNGFEMALRQNKDNAVTVIYEDDAYTPAKTVGAFRKLVAIDKVDLLISCASSPSASIAPLAEQHKIPLIAWASDDRVAKGRSYVVRSWVSGGKEAQVAAEEARSRGIKKIAYLSVSTDYGRSIKEGMEKYFGINNILVNEEYLPDAIDFKPFFLKVKTAGVKDVGACLAPGMGALFARQARELGMKISLFGCEFFHDMKQVQQAQGALIGAWLVTGAAEDWFVEKYRQQFGNEDVISGAAIHYDIANLLQKVARAKVKGKDIIPALIAAGKQNGAIGPFRVISEEADQYFSIPLAVKEITESGFTVRRRAE